MSSIYIKNGGKKGKEDKAYKVQSSISNETCEMRVTHNFFSTITSTRMYIGATVLINLNKYINTPKKYLDSSVCLLLKNHCDSSTCLEIVKLVEK